MKPRILLVDDDLAVLLTLKAVLELNKFTVHTAASAVEAVERLNAEVYDLVISDVHMSSEREGLDVIRAAKLQPYHPAIALLTAHPPADFNWRSHGVQSLLIKPVGTEELVRQIRALLLRQQSAKIVTLKESRDQLGPEGRRKAV